MDVEVEEVTSRAGDDPQPGEGDGLELQEGRIGSLEDADVLRGLEQMAVGAVRQDHAGPVEPELEARRRGQRRAQGRTAMLVLRVEPGHGPVAVELLDLVAVDGVVEEEGEV